MPWQRKSWFQCSECRHIGLPAYQACRFHSKFVHILHRFITISPNKSEKSRFRRSRSLLGQFFKGTSHNRGLIFVRVCMEDKLACQKLPTTAPFQKYPRCGIAVIRTAGRTERTLVFDKILNSCELYITHASKLHSGPINKLTASIYSP